MLRGHQDEVLEVRYTGAEQARPSPGVCEAIVSADVVIIGPSNPPLSIWPILAIREIWDAMAEARRVMAVSPLFGGRALKGPADRVMASLGLPAGNSGVLAAYENLVDDLFIDTGDREDVAALSGMRTSIHVGPTRIAGRDQATAFAARMMEVL